MKRLVLCLLVLAVGCASNATDEAAEPTPTEGLSLEAALQILDEQGYATEDTSIYRSDGSLTVLIGYPKDCGAGCPMSAFFFADGGFVGRDADTPSGAVDVASQSGDEVTLRYGLYRRGDANCCPSEEATVRFGWDGSELQVLDLMPPADARRASG